MKVKFQEKEEIQIQEKLTCAYSIHYSQEEVAKNCKLLFPPSRDSFLPFTRLALWCKTYFCKYIYLFYCFKLLFSRNKKVGSGGF